MCRLGELLWNGKISKIQPNLDYLAYEGKYLVDQLYWIGPSNTTRAINGRGQVVVLSGDSILPVLCTSTAPFSNSTWQDTSERWQTVVKSNNESYTG